MTGHPAASAGIRAESAEPCRAPGPPDRVADEVRSCSPAVWSGLASGVLAVALGLAMLVWPDISLRTMAALTGVWLLLSGIAGVVAASSSRGGRRLGPATNRMR
jgi:hypothetical protein